MPPLDLARGRVLCADQPVPVLDIDRLIQAVVLDHALQRLLVLGDIAHVERRTLHRAEELQHAKDEDGDPKQDKGTINRRRMT